MARFARNRVTPRETVNHEGGRSFTKSPELDLVSLLVTSTLDDTFYESGVDRVRRMKELVRAVDPEFAARAAVYARKDMNMRSAPMLMLAMLAQTLDGQNRSQLLRRAVRTAITRADELSELPAAYKLLNGGNLKPMPRGLKEGLSDAFGKFNEYQIAKYRAGSKDISLRDVMFLVHPKPKNDEQAKTFERLAENSLSSTETWEANLTKAGQNANTEEERFELKSAAWSQMIDTGPIGLFALIRNLRNMLESKLSEDHITKICAMIKDPVRIRNSRIFPFRFWTAYKELANATSSNKWNQIDLNRILDALDTAIGLSMSNIPGVSPDTKILVAVDVSGSMHSRFSANSSVAMYEIGAVMAAGVLKIGSSNVAGMFGDIFMPVRGINSSSVANFVNDLYRKEGCVGYSTNFHKVFEFAQDHPVAFDRIYVFTDGQMWSTFGGDHVREWRKLKEKCPGIKCFAFDLQGYRGSFLDTEDKDYYTVSGFSDKIFSVLETNAEDIIEQINRIELS